MRRAEGMTGVAPCGGGDGSGARQWRAALGWHEAVGGAVGGLGAEEDEGIGTQVEVRAKLSIPPPCKFVALVKGPTNLRVIVRAHHVPLARMFIGCL